MIKCRDAYLEAAQRHSHYYQAEVMFEAADSTSRARLLASARRAPLIRRAVGQLYTTRQNTSRSRTISRHDERF